MLKRGRDEDQLPVNIRCSAPKFNLKLFVKLSMIGLVLLLMHFIFYEPPVRTYLDEKSCTNQQNQVQIKRVLPFLKNNNWYWGCTSPFWIQLLHKFSPSTDKTFVHVGFGKGYHTAHLYNLWNPSVGLNVGTLYEAISEVAQLNDQDCGICSDCKLLSAPLTPAKENRGLIKVISYDPHPTVLSRHQKVIEAKFPALQNAWTATKGSVSDKEGFDVFPISKYEKPSDGDGVDNEKSSSASVKVINGADIISLHKLERIYFFKTQADGHDPDVLRGIRPLLVLHQITVVEFEYQGHDVWHDSSVESIVRDFDTLGYECYLLGRVCAVSLSNTCWNHEYETHSWANVRCISRVDGEGLILETDARTFAKNRDCTKD